MVSIRVSRKALLKNISRERCRLGHDSVAGPFKTVLAFVMVTEHRAHVLSLG